MSDLIVRALQTQEYGHAASLVADVLAGQDQARYRKIYARYAQQLPVRPANIPPYRAAFKGDQLVALIHIVDYVLRYGRATLPIVAVGMLCTHPDYRHQGYAGAVVKDTLTFAAEQGAHMVLINSTIDQYFQVFGFSPIWPQYHLQIPVQSALQCRQRLRLRVATPDDLEEMALLYDRYWGMRVTVERSPMLWRWRMAHGRGESLVMVNDAGRIKGYLWHLPDDFSGRNEVVVGTPDAIETALAYSGRRWQSGGHETLCWSVPPDDVIVPYAQQMVPLILSANYAPSSGWMGRVIDARALLQALLPEILAQAHSNNPRITAQSLLLAIVPDGVSLGLRSVPDTRCQLSLRDFIQVLFGSLSPDSLAVRQPLSDESLRLLHELFPPRIASLAGWDWL
ncbi:MAG: GNAT family N-acetyltransferase [Anaerolineae bacterium]